MDVHTDAQSSGRGKSLSDFLNLAERHILFVSSLQLSDERKETKVATSLLYKRINSIKAFF